MEKSLDLALASSVATASGVISAFAGGGGVVETAAAAAATAAAAISGRRCLRCVATALDMGVVSVRRRPRTTDALFVVTVTVLPLRGRCKCC